MILPRLMVVAGVGQLLLILGSLAIPRVLGWKEETAKLRLLTRQVFWTYAAYIWFTNLCFGLISVFFSATLLDRSILATLVTGFIAAYWAARVGIQFFYFDRADLRGGIAIRLAETALVILFVFLTAIYMAAVIFNLRGQG